MKNLKISVITVSYNQGQFIEENILSILNQNYDNFEHIIVDACSTDCTLEVLKKYPHLLWTSEKDKGQSDGLNKGFKRATGDIIVWLNSDDTMCEGAFDVINKFFVENPDKSVLTGNQIVIKGDSSFDHRIQAKAVTHDMLLNTRYCSVMQNSTVWRKEVFDKVGYLDESFHYNMDFELFVRISEKYTFYEIDADIANFRVWEESKTTTSHIKFLKEKWRAKQKHHARLISSGNYWLLCQFIKDPIKRFVQYIKK